MTNALLGCASLIILGSSSSPGIDHHTFNTLLNKGESDRISAQSDNPQPAEHGWGFTDRELDPLDLLCISQFESTSELALDVGAGSGKMTLQMLNAGKYVIAVETSLKSLAKIYLQAPEQYRQHLWMVRGYYPRNFAANLENLPPPTRALIEASDQRKIGLAYLSRVMHFMSVPQLWNTPRMLRQHGRSDMLVFASVASPRNKKFKDFLPVYYERQRWAKKSQLWGVAFVQDYLPPSSASHYPRWVNLLDQEHFALPFQSAGFNVFTFEYPERDKRPDNTLDGKERIGLVAWLPSRKAPEFPPALKLDGLHFRPALIE